MRLAYFVEQGAGSRFARSIPRIPPIRDAPPTDASTQARQQLDAGRAYEHSGMTDRALEAYRDAISGATTDSDRAEGHVRAGHLLLIRSEFDAAKHHADEAYAIARRSGSDDLAAEAINLEVGRHLMRGDLDDADSESERALVLSRSPRVLGITLQNRAAIAARRGELVRARSLLEESIVAFREARYEIGITVSLVNAAMIAHDASEFAEALDLGDMAIASARSLMAHDLLVAAIQNQAHTMVQLGRFDEAHSMLSEAFGFFTAAGNVIRQAECLEIMGDLSAGRDGEPTTALLAFERARELAKRGGDAILAERITAKIEKLRVEVPPKL